MKKFFIVLLVFPFITQAQTSESNTGSSVNKTAYNDTRTQKNEITNKNATGNNNIRENESTDENKVKTDNMFGWVKWQYSACKKAPTKEMTEVANLPIVSSNQGTKTKVNQVKSKG